MNNATARLSFCIVLLNTIAAQCNAQTTAPSALKTDKLQEPPMQRAEWTPPKTDLPADVVAATTKLFQQGLADPRGCEYREIGVRVGDRESGDAGVLACHRWVLPDAGKGAQRFAVCWNGLVYPVEWISGKATVGTDVQISIERDDGWETFVEQSACSRESGRGTRGPDCLPNERVNVSGHFMLPLRVCLLLRLGEKDLAEKFWKAWAAKPGQDCPHYKLLALALEWSMYDCALNAHRRGDDRLSFVYAASVKLLHDSVLKEFQKFNYYSDDRSELERCLGQINALVQDAKRRRDDQPRILALVRGEAAFAGRQAWIAALIADLDQVTYLAKGEFDDELDPIMVALIACGEDAVEPLLDCMAHDERLTRDGLPPARVETAAYQALMQVLQIRDFGKEPAHDGTLIEAQQRQQMVQIIRDYFMKVKGLSPSQRWLVDRDGNVDRNPGSEHIGRSETHMGPVGKEMTLRTCDRIAMEISQIGGGPEMKLYWPEEERNAAVKACVGFLNQYGERFKYREGFDGQAIGSHGYTIAFPSLGHPASKKEAASKEAIFSLEGEGEARVVRDMKLPATARWTTLKNHPFEDPEGGKIDFDNYCWIWQAEEVKVNGVWHRYYGVVGPNEIARVPAEEIEFDTPVELHGNYVLGWTPLSGDADVCASFEKRYQPRGSGFNFAVGEPVLMKLRFHDRSGMPKQWPTSFFSKSDRAMQTRPGMQMSLQWRAREPSPIDDDADNPAQMIQTKYVTLRKTGAPEQLTTVESNGALEAGEFDLRDFFDITKPGIYRLQIRFTTDSRVGEGETPVEFELK